MNIYKLNDQQFRRRTGVKKKTFEFMLTLLRENEIKKQKEKIGGRPNKLSEEEELLLTLSYLREYRTLFHISQDYGISEATCSRIVRKVEDILIQSQEFHLPKRKEKLLNEDSLEVFLVDATETPIERPKKN